MKRITESKLFFWSAELLVIFTLIFVMSHTLFVFVPIKIFIQTLFPPVLIALFLFYLLKPIVEIINRKTKFKRSKIVLFVFLTLVFLFFLTISTLIPLLMKQISEFIKSIPFLINSLNEWTEKVSLELQIDKIQVKSFLDSIDISIPEVSKSFFSSLSTGTVMFVSNIFHVLVILFTVPMFLFYLLKDSEKMVENVIKTVPKSAQKDAAELIKKMNSTISAYISGQAFECLFVAVGTFIGYLLFGIDYALMFAVLAGVTNIIPYIGPYLGLAPVVLTTIFDSPVKALVACIVVLVVQQIDSNMVYPNVMGKSLDIHPLTVFIILLVAGNISGLIGMILGVPFYAVTKVVVLYVIDLRKLKKKNEIIETETF
ncbi:AI-2E family transporter [Vagococcus fluvialis]|uniref:AI-2E family transporter n=1 Tax=Vagococcus fluvialis TaxID=2738 RepID=UPI003D1130D6